MYIGKKSIRFYKEDYNPQRHKIKYFTMNVDDRFAGTLLENSIDIIQIRVQITMRKDNEKITRIKYVGENLENIENKEDLYKFVKYLRSQMYGNPDNIPWK